MADQPDDKQAKQNGRVFLVLVLGMIVVLGVAGALSATEDESTPESIAQTQEVSALPAPTTEPIEITTQAQPTTQPVETTAPAPTTPAPPPVPVEPAIVDEPEPTYKAPQDMIPGVDYDPDELFLLNLMVGDVNYTSEPEVLEAGRYICNRIDAGRSLIDIQLNAIRSGYSSYEAGYLIGAAITAYCPQYEYMVN